MLWTSRDWIVNEKTTKTKVSRWHFVVVAVDFKRDRLVRRFDMHRKYKGSCLPRRPLPGISTSDMRVRRAHVTNSSDRSPTERRRHVTDGVAKQPKTSSVLLKCVRWGLDTAWPRHWPHMKTWPLWVLAADVWLVWHAATSTILEMNTGSILLQFKMFCVVFRE